MVNFSTESTCGSNAEIQVGIFGTFDVENYGDLLFPLIAQSQLSLRNPNVNVVAFSPNAVSKGQLWPFDVLSTESLGEKLPSLSALLIGGGQIVRFDKGYPIPVNANSNIPIDYWLSPASLGALLGKPVIWNAIGAWTGSPVPEWCNNILKATLSASAIVAVRDTASHEHLSRVDPSAEIQIIPDTAFSLARLWPNDHFSALYLSWALNYGVRDSYVVIQADSFIAKHLNEVVELIHSLSITTVVILPVCRCHGDSSDDFPSIPSVNVVRSEWLEPTLICEVISQAKLLVASSLHACITSACYGVPCVRVESFNSYDRKFEILNGLENICLINESDRVRELVLRGNVVDPKVTRCSDLLEAYWDEVAKIIAGWSAADGKCATSIMLPFVIDTFKHLEIADAANVKSNKKPLRWNPFAWGA